MKKYILFFIMIIFIWSCKKDFLDEKPVTTLTQDYYLTSDGLETLTKGCYQILRFKSDYNEGHYIFGIGSDVEVYCWSLQERIDNGSYNSSGWSSYLGSSTGQRYPQQVSSMITTVYRNVSRCNTFLDYYDKLSAADQTKLAARKGEVLFLRAWSYYLITNVLGPVPFILKPVNGLPSNFNYTKESLENIYKRLIGDLRTAVDLLPATTSQLGRITKPAAAHFLAKLYLNRAQASGWAASPQTDLQMLYKGNVSTDLDSVIYYTTTVIDQLKTNSIYGGLETDFGKLWKNVKDNYDRDNCKEIILSAQYEPTQTYNGSSNGDCLVMLYNSNYTTLRSGVSRNYMEYGRPYATAGASDWAFDMYDHANDSRYYKTFLTDYQANDVANTIAGSLLVKNSKPWDAGTALYFNTYLKTASDATAVKDAYKIIFGKTGLIYIENSKTQPVDSLWAVSQPFLLMARWMVGSPNSSGYFTKTAGVPTGFKTGAVDPANLAVITNYAAQNRKLYYRISADKGEPFGLDRGLAVTQWYCGPRKWLDINRGTGIYPNNGGAIDVVQIRLAETYLIRAEAYGRKSNYPAAITDLNVLRARAAYHKNDTRSEVLIKYEPGSIAGTFNIPAGEKVSPYSVATDSYAKITIDGTEWQTGSPKAARENYPVEAASDADKFIQFIYNERARELIFEELTVEDLHNAGILYERVRDRDMMGAPATSTGTVNFPFPDDDLNTSLGANGIGKGMVHRYNLFKPWTDDFIILLTDEQGNVLDDATKKAFQNPGY